MAKYLHIPTVFGTATGAVALKRVKHLINNLEKRYSYKKQKYNKPYLFINGNSCSFLLMEINRLKAEKKAIIAEIKYYDKRP